MATFLGGIGLLLIPIGAILFLAGLLKKNDNLKRKGIKGFGIGCVLFIIGIIFVEPTPKTNDTSIPRAAEQVVQKESKKDENKKDILKNTATPVINNQKNTTPITEELLEKYKIIAVSNQLQKEELAEILMQIDKVAGLKRFEMEKVNDSYNFYLKSLPDEIKYQYPAYFGIEVDSKTGKKSLRGFSISAFGSINEVITLYDSQNESIRPNINDLFIKKTDAEIYSKILHSKTSKLTEIKGVDPNSIKIIDDYYSVNLRQDLNTRESYALFGYQTVVSYEKKYYGGSTKYIQEIYTAFDSRKRHEPIKIFYNNHLAGNPEDLKPESFAGLKSIVLNNINNVVNFRCLSDENSPFK